MKLFRKATALVTSIAMISAIPTKTHPTDLGDLTYRYSNTNIIRIGKRAPKFIL